MKGNKKLWFKRKTYGYGWTPATKEGWVVIIIYTILLLVIFSNIDNTVEGPRVLSKVVFPTLILTGLLIFLCYKKGEKPKWQWGEKED